MQKNKLVRRFHLPRKLLLIFALPFLWYLGTLLFIIITGPADTANRADVALVLGTGILANGEPNPCLAARVEKGVELFRNGAVQAVILSGGSGEQRNARKRGNSMRQSQADAMREIALAAGMDDRYLFTEPNSTSTYENILFSREGLEYFQASSVIVVTEPYHSPRARMTAERHLEQDVQMAPASESPCWRGGAFGGWYLLREPFALWYYVITGKL
ncbi:MAG: YdcF family protein [Patescibacteria group bacterium]|nr:YdcF family protein [Patescibacteria group bacterium]